MTRLNENQITPVVITELELAAALEPINQSIAAHTQDISDLQTLVNSSNIFATLSRTGLLNITNGNARWYPPKDLTIETYEAWLGTAPGGATIIQICKNTVPVQEITINNGVIKVSGVTSIVMTIADFLTVNITQIHVAQPGSDLSVRLKGK